MPLLSILTDAQKQQPVLVIPPIGSMVQFPKVPEIWDAPPTMIIEGTKLVLIE
jgi:hypothetical protein